MKFTGYYLLKEKDLVRNNSVKEMIKIIDAKDSERKYAQKKYASKIDFIDLEARNLFLGKSATSSMIKYAYRLNHYSVRDKIINKKLVGSEYPRYSEVETQDYIVRCREMKKFRVDFIKKVSKRIDRK